MNILNMNDIKHSSTQIDLTTPEVHGIIGLLKKKIKEIEYPCLSAPQLGVYKRAFIIDLTENKSSPNIFINPEILSYSDNIVLVDETCASNPNKITPKNRIHDLIVSYYDDMLQPRECELHGLTATIFQHEIEHLMGITTIIEES